jgi:hypothetical protein
MLKEIAILVTTALSDAPRYLTLQAAVAASSFARSAGSPRRVGALFTTARAPFLERKRLVCDGSERHER